MKYDSVVGAVYTLNVTAVGLTWSLKFFFSFTEGSKAKSPVTLLLTATFRVLPGETVKKSICTISGEQHPEDRSTL